MLKKNKSITDWLLQQDQEERNRLLRIASNKGQDLRVKHQQMQVDALREIEADIEEKRREKEKRQSEREPTKTRSCKRLGATMGQ